VELGTAYGGTTLFMARVLDAIGSDGIVATVDIDVSQRTAPDHGRIIWLEGDSVALRIRDKLYELAAVTVEDGPVLVIADSDHTRGYVAAELEMYAPLVGPRSYFIVEDTNHYYLNGPGETPLDAVRDFLAIHREFEADPKRQRHLVTFNPGGYLRRRSDVLET